MITEFGVGNFQAFGELQRVPLKPITLIFGPNSAGKSALIRSLLVAQHAILNGKLSKSEGANERHPGSYADIVRNGNSDPISFGFSVQPEGKSNGAALELYLSWKETLPGGIETVTLSLKEKQSAVATYSSKWNSKLLQIESLGNELRQLVASPALDSDVDGVLTKCIESSVTRRLALQKNVALPASDQDHFRTEDRKEADSIALFVKLVEVYGEKDGYEWVSKYSERIKATVDSIQSMITTRIKRVDELVQKDLATLTYHGPIRPICDEISNSRKSEPGMAEWWNLAADPKLLTKVNHWLASGIFKTTYRLEFDRLFPDSSLQQFLQSLSHERDIEQLVQAAFEAKLDTDESFFESLIDDKAPDLEQFFEDVDEDERVAAARHQARDSIYNDAWGQAEEHYNDLLAESDVNEIETFLLLGVNRTLDYLRGKLEAVRQGKTSATPGSFDSAKVRFCDLGSSKAVAPSNMGIGFSQMMPLVASAFGSENRLIAIEQPELHVHPALQTELADLFIQSAMERKNRFLIETHSEHLILRVLRRIRETTRGTLPEGKTPIRREDVAVLYVQPSPEGSKVIEMRIDDQGRLVDNWPNGFFEERLDELF